MRSPITSFARNVYYLWLEQIVSLRAFWLWYLIAAVLFPTVMIFGLTHISQLVPDPALVTRIISGTIVFSLTNEGVVNMALQITAMRERQTLLFYSALPVNKTELLIALMLSRALITLPSALVPLVVGATSYGMALNTSVGSILIIGLLAVMLSAVGMAIGFLGRTVAETQVATTVILLVVVMLSPVFIPTEALPDVLQWIARLLPFTYASTALRLALAGQYDVAFWTNVAILTGMAVLAIGFVEKTLRWRLD